MMNSMAIQLFLLSFVLVTFSCNPGSNSVQHKELSKDQSGLRWLTDIITWITWLLRSILSVVYFIIYTIVLTLTYFMATLFSLLHQFIKLIEFLWYLVRLVLQASHNFVSSCFYNTRMRSIVQNSYIFLKDLLVSTARTFLSLMKTILDFLLHIVFNMPKLLKVIIDLLYTVILWCGHFLLFIGKNIGSLAFKISQSTMHLFQRIWAAIKTFGPIIFTYTKSLFYGVLQFIQAIFPIFYDVIMTILKTIGLFVGHCGRFVLNTFIALARFVYNMARTIIEMGTQLIPSIKAIKAFGTSTLNTLKVVIDLLYTGILWCGHFLLLIGKNIISLAFKTSQTMIHLFQRILAAIKTCGSIIFTCTKSLFYGVFQFIFTVFNHVMSILGTIGLFVEHCVKFVLNTFIDLARLVYYMAKTITTGTPFTPNIKASKVSVMSMFLIITSITLAVFKINIFILGFGYLESLIQYVTALKRSVNNQQTVIDNSRQSSNSTPRNEKSLRRQLELEKDKTLCVVCQGEVKKILFLPCRHLCTCVKCAKLIDTKFDQLCPLCRTQVKSTIEVYS